MSLPSKPSEINKKAKNLLLKDARFDLLLKDAR
jgi:hypothetical protein